MGKFREIFGNFLTLVPLVDFLHLIPFLDSRFLLFMIRVNRILKGRGVGPLGFENEFSKVEQQERDFFLLHYCPPGLSTSAEPPISYILFSQKYARFEFIATAC